MSRAPGLPCRVLLAPVELAMCAEEARSAVRRPGTKYRTWDGLILLAGIPLTN